MNRGDPYLLSDGAANPPSLTYQYGEVNGRLEKVLGTNGFSATYTYVPQSALPATLTFAQGQDPGTTRLTTTRTYDFLNRLQTISSVAAGGTSPARFEYAYAYNDRNQRVRVGLADRSCWLYVYDNLGQIKSAKKYWSEGTPVPGQQFEYGFDDIGNRTTVKSGGDSQGGTLRTSEYESNLRNQYTSRTVPESLDVIGLANANATVTVNGQSPYRHGEYFQASVPVGNCPDAVQYPEITVTATRSGYSTEQESGHIFVPGCAEAFEYDADGNLLHDDRWDYTWDAENRLVRMVARTAAGPQQWIEFQYDWRGRRVAKTVWANVQRTDPPAASLKFLYDGWNLVAEIDAMQTPATVTRHYVWGLDLSGSLEGAGGVGGMLAIYSTLNPQPSTHFVAYDGNGNVMALVDSTTGRASAEYLYGPFGELLARSGVMAEVNAIRFSSKYQDVETGLCYYGHRYSNPSTGRWLSRDPIGELGGVNVYGFVRNDAVNGIDSDGLITLTWGHLAAIFLEGAGIVIDTIKVPEWLDNLVIDNYGGPEAFMDATEKELLAKGGTLPRDMFTKARAKDKDPIDESAIGNEKALYDRLRAELLSSKLYKTKRDFIMKRLQEGTFHRGFVNVDFQDAGEASLGYAIGGAQLHYSYKYPPPTLELRLIDTYDFTRKKHMWGRLQKKGYLVTYDIDVMIETIACPKAAPEKR